MLDSEEVVQFISYNRVQRDILETSAEGRDTNVLLGNGFSIGCDPVFNYESLYRDAITKLSHTAKSAFEHLGSNNFEGVLHLLGQATWAIEHYTEDENASDQIDEDIESVKNALIAAIANGHLARPSDVPDEKKEAAALFLQPYTNVFTTNYDLLLYWVMMYGNNRKILKPVDGFSGDAERTTEDLVFFDHLRGTFYLHGALHLWTDDGRVKKHSWSREHMPLIELVRTALDDDRYPLFVAEGDSDKKLTQIEGSSYLSHCLERLRHARGPLVIYGHSLSDFDNHILSAIVINPFIPHIYVGLRNPPSHVRSKRIIAKASAMATRRERIRSRQQYSWWPTLEVEYFRSSSAPVWG